MKKSANANIYISVKDQELTLKQGRTTIAVYPVSTSRFGLGTEEGSEKTPTGRFRIAEAIGENLPIGTVFKGRRPVKVKKKELSAPDLIMSRILWLDGLDVRNANTYRRFIYIHGTNHEEEIGHPASHGCIRMKNLDVIELFEGVTVGTTVVIRA